MNWQSTNGSRGFTLVELMVAMLLGLLLCIATTSLYLRVRDGFDRDDSVVRMQDDARQAVHDLTNDLSMAGFWADLLLPASVTPDDALTVGADCGPTAVAKWIYRPVVGANSESLTGVDNATGASANAAYSCIAASEIVAGTDVIAIKRAAGARLTTAAVTNSVYFRTNGTVGLLYKQPDLTPPAVAVPAPFTEWEYRPAIYYIRNYANTVGDGIPTLCRKALSYSAAPTMATDCLAQGIEDLQIEYGLDPDGDAEPNLFVQSPTLAELQTAVAVRVYILVRSAEPDPQYTNGKTYEISNAASRTPADHFYRRVFSETVALHNIASLRKLRS